MDEKGSVQYLERRYQFVRAIPDALSIGKTLLYIGAKTGRMQMFDLFADAKHKIDILEAWSPNVAELLRWNAEVGRARLIIRGDVRQIEFEKGYDVAMWWHGPEHVAADELENALRRIEAAAKRIVILASPWGRYAQGLVEGNPFEAHRNSIYPETLQALGYETDAIGAKDRKGSNLLAWKRLE
jgi:hypothetical protein